ncbi:DgyrCDS11875 [Dimorphilus gyrociliatus]|uniref:Large ribosomal subunit protein mL64 n=1 Tax=Dimorphilus gyrociliatus TaxID=2664684 RepID=A0A7I8W4Q6_9ANNE|nr:DgyrCDS11875 [Dimorphilus gyrociliatus]
MRLIQVPLDKSRLLTSLSYILRQTIRHRSGLKSRKAVLWDQAWPIHEEKPEVDEETARRNISGLRKKFRDRLPHVMEPSSPEFELHFTKQHKMRMFGKYGSKSGIHPGIHWPSKEELKELIEEEQIWEPSLAERMNTVLAEENEIRSTKLKKEEEIAKNLKNMPKYIAQFEKKLEKVEEEEDLRRDKQKQLVEEAYDYFGYKVDSRDPRFIKMIEEKEEEEKRISKIKKKEQRQEKLLASMKAMMEKNTKSSPEDKVTTK